MTSYAAPNWDTIPADMRARPNWVLWKSELNKDGKLTKIPYNAATHRKADTTIASTWKPFDMVKSVYISGGYDGVGHVFTEGDDLIFVDLDHCFDADGNISARAQALINEFGTYAERSPNDGLHLFARGKLDGEHHKRGDVEIYWNKRFSTITGHQIPGTPSTPQLVNGPLDRLYQSIAPLPFLTGNRSDESSVGVQEKNYDSALSDSDVVAKAGAAHNGAKFHDLMAGDIFGYGGDESAADLALCGILAFWCGNDTAQMDRIFRTSALMRPKWDSRRGNHTYGQQTIAKARSETTYNAPSDDSSAGLPEYDHDTVILSEKQPFILGNRSDESSARGVHEIPWKFKEIAQENIALKEQAARQDARIAELVRELYTAQTIIDRVAAEKPEATIRRLEDRIADLEQEKLEILVLARDTALNPTDRIAGIIWKEAGRAYRRRLRMGEEPQPIKEQRVHVSALEVEAGIGKGTASRHIKPVIARGHFKYRIVPDDTPADKGPPRSVALIAPGDSVLRTMVDLRRQREREEKERQRGLQRARETKQIAVIAELAGALEAAQTNGCPECSGTLLPTGYQCTVCSRKHSTYDLAQHVVGEEIPPTISSEPTQSRTNLYIQADDSSDGQAIEPDRWLSEGDPHDF